MIEETTKGIEKRKYDLLKHPLSATGSIDVLTLSVGKINRKIVSRI